MKTKRIVSFLIDLGIISLIGVIISFICVKFISNDIISSILNTLPVSLLIGKDLIGGQSIGKRIFHLCVIEKLPKNRPVPNWKLIVRNLFFVVWPIDFVCYLMSGHRIGDIILKTDITEVAFNSYSFKWSILMAFVVVWGIVFLMLIYYSHTNPLMQLL